MAGFVWDGSKSNKMLKDAWEKAVSKDPHVSKQTVIINLTQEERAILAAEGRLVDSAYRRLCYMDRAGLL